MVLQRQPPESFPDLALVIGVFCNLQRAEQIRVLASLRWHLAWRRRRALWWCARSPLTSPAKARTAAFVMISMLCDEVLLGRAHLAVLAPDPAVARVAGAALAVVCPL